MKESKNYCTLFSSNYLARALAMISSLLRHSPDACIFVLCMDDDVKIVLEKYFPKNCIPITLEEFETNELKTLKKERSLRAFCWTCTPYIIHYCIEKFGLNSCTYIDADLYFYSSPEVLHSELNGKSVSIISHRYTPKYDYSKTSGTYCVQFMTFENNAEGLEVLLWWKNACREWCFDWFEDGKFGDQKYLDDWPMRFKGVKELLNIGGGVAPWNCQQYTLERDQNSFVIKDKNTNEQQKIVFYHFHGIRFLKPYIDLGHYELDSKFKDEMYVPYIRELLSWNEILLKENLSINPINLQKTITLADLKYIAYKFIHGNLGITLYP